MEEQSPSKRLKTSDKRNICKTTHKVEEDEKDEEPAVSFPSDKYNLLWHPMDNPFGRKPDICDPSALKQVEPPEKVVCSQVLNPFPYLKCPKGAELELLHIKYTQVDTKEEGEDEDAEGRTVIGKNNTFYLFQSIKFAVTGAVKTCITFKYTEKEQTKKYYVMLPPLNVIPLTQHFKRKPKNTKPRKTKNKSTKQDKNNSTTNQETPAPQAVEASQPIPDVPTDLSTFPPFAGGILPPGQLIGDPVRVRVDGFFPREPSCVVVFGKQLVPIVGLCWSGIEVISPEGTVPETVKVRIFYGEEKVRRTQHYRYTNNKEEHRNLLYNPPPQQDPDSDTDFREIEQIMNNNTFNNNNTFSNSNSNESVSQGNPPPHFNTARYNQVLQSDQVNTAGKYGYTALHEVAYLGYLKHVQYLVERGANLNARDCDGRTPLSWAVQFDHEEVVGYLLQHGAEVDLADINGFTPLHIALITKNFYTARVLLMCGADKTRKAYDTFDVYECAELTPEQFNELLLSDPTEMKLEPTQIAQSPMPSYSILVAHSVIGIGNNLSFTKVEPMDSSPEVDATEFAKEALRLGLQNQMLDLTKEQKEVIQLIAKNHHVLYNDKTGAGKSETYFLATKFMRKTNSKAGPVIVVTPLRSLMDEQLRRATSFGLEARAWKSKNDQPDSDRTKVVVNNGKLTLKIVKELFSNKVDLLFLTPEMLEYIIQNPNNPLLKKLPQMQKTYLEDKNDAWNCVPLVVIDEIHYISEAGHDFRPACMTVWKSLADYPWFKHSLKLGLTATLNTRIDIDIRSVLPISWQLVTGDPHRSNIAIRVITNVCSIQGRVQWLFEHATDEENKEKSILVFVTRIDQGEKYQAELTKLGLPVGFYHANLDAQLKADLEQKFRNGEIRVLLTTTALGLGYDKKDIRDVVHMHSPLSLVQYYQEIGRAGRDGKPARAFLLPSRVWEPVGWLNALQKVVSFLKNFAEERDHVEHYLLRLRFSEGDIEDAFFNGFQRGILGFQGTKVVVKNEKLLLFEQLWGIQRIQEAEAMQQLNANPDCCWRFILEKLFNKPNISKWCCGTCSGKDCQPGGDLRANPFAGEEYCYSCKTRGGLTVYGLADANEDLGLDIDRIKAIAENYIPELTKDPSSWTLAYVPDSNGNNRLEAERICEALSDLELVDYIESSPHAKMAGAKNDVARQEVIESGKFRFKEDKIPKSGCVILYDDAVISGTTLDYVAKPLLERKLQVVAIVHRVFPFENRKLRRLPINDAAA